MFLIEADIINCALDYVKTLSQDIVELLPLSQTMMELLIHDRLDLILINERYDSIVDDIDNLNPTIDQICKTINPWVFQDDIIAPIYLRY